MRTALVIPAKGTSERVLGKNLIRINGKSLVYRACEKSLKCKEVDFVYLDTECEAIKADVSDLINKGLRIIDRPQALASNSCNANDLLIWALHSVEDVDLICQTFATSPLITSKTMDKAIRAFKNFGNFDSFFTINNVKEYFWSDRANPINFCPEVLPNSQDLDPMLMETHGLYGVTVEALVKGKKRVGSNPFLYPVNKIEALDVDDNEDLEIVRAIIEKREKDAG